LLSFIMFYTYILYSGTINKYYVGYTSDLEKRIGRHGSDKNKFTGQTEDWELIKYFEFSSKSEAMKLESKIKKRGIKRFLDSLNK
jgi:putative endonuclease